MQALSASFFERLEDNVLRLHQRVMQRLGRRGQVIISLLSAVWGGVSGFTLTRDYAHSRQLVASFAGFVLLSAGFRVWAEYARRHAGGPAKGKGQAKAKGLSATLLARPKLVESAAATGTQACIQYILMYCIPLLFFARAWVTGLFAVALALSCLVDRWWRSLSHLPWYGAVIRSFCAVLATSFAFGVLFPNALVLFYPTLSLVAVLTAAPWGLIAERRWPEVEDIVTCVSAAIVFGVQETLNAWIRFPLLSVWLTAPMLGVGVAGRALRSPFTQPVSHAELANALASHEGLCCLTPVVAPSGVASSVTHEWLVDGEPVERIVLPVVYGRDDRGGAFRTYSCKHNLPRIASAQTVTCRVLLEDQIYLGRAQASIE